MKKGMSYERGKKAAGPLSVSIYFHHLLLNSSVEFFVEPSKLKMRSPSASTISFSAASSVTLKKCLSSGSLAMYLISLRKASGLIPLRL